jgi:hypothetical protein
MVRGAQNDLGEEIEEVYRVLGFLVFFLVVHERYRLSYPFGPGGIILIQFNFSIEVAKVMIY